MERVDCAALPLPTSRRDCAERFNDCIGPDGPNGRDVGRVRVCAAVPHGAFEGPE